MIKIHSSKFLNLKAGSSYIGVEGMIKADASTSVIGGLKIGGDKKSNLRPVAEFGGVKATFVAAATVKFGIFNVRFMKLLLIVKTSTLFSLFFRFI